MCVCVCVLVLARMYKVGTVWMCHVGVFIYAQLLRIISLIHTYVYTYILSYVVFVSLGHCQV
jgi:hypothetical protein